MAFPTRATPSATPRRSPRGRSHLGRRRERRRRVRAGHARRRPRRTSKPPRSTSTADIDVVQAAAERRLDAGHRPDLRPGRRRPPRRRRLGVQRLGRPGLGPLGQATRRSARSSPTAPGASSSTRRWSTRAAASRSTAWARVLVTETVQLDPGRNPAGRKADVEAELARTHRRHQRGLAAARPDPRLGRPTAPAATSTSSPAIPSPGVLLVHDQRDPAHPDHDVSREAIELLSHATDPGRAARGRSCPCPRPKPCATTRISSTTATSTTSSSTAESSRAHSATPTDRDAAAVLADAYPGRRVVSVDARPLFARGGGIHCITQHQPAPAPSPRNPCTTRP